MKNSSFVRFYHCSDKILNLGDILGKSFSLSVKAYLVESKSIKSLSDWFAVQGKILSNHLKLFVESTQKLLKKETPHFMTFSKLTDLIHQRPTFLRYRNQPVDLECISIKWFPFGEKAIHKKAKPQKTYVQIFTGVKTT